MSAKLTTEKLQELLTESITASRVDPGAIDAETLAIDVMRRLNAPRNGASRAQFAEYLARNTKRGHGLGQLHNLREWEAAGSPIWH